MTARSSCARTVTVSTSVGVACGSTLGTSGRLAIMTCAPSTPAARMSTGNPNRASLERRGGVRKPPVRGRVSDVTTGLRRRA